MKAPFPWAESGAAAGTEQHPLIDRDLDALDEFLHPEYWDDDIGPDYDGHIVEIGETMPHLVRRLHAEGVPREKIRDFTGWPLEKIDGIT